MSRPMCLIAALSLEHNHKLKNQDDVDTAVITGMTGGLTMVLYGRCNPFEYRHCIE